MLNLRKDDIDFIKAHIGDNSVLLKTDDIGVFLEVLYNWIDMNGFDDTGENYNNLGRGAQRVYDYAYANND